MIFISSDTHLGVSKHCNAYVWPQFLRVSAGVKDDAKVEPELVFMDFYESQNSSVIFRISMKSAI